MDGKKQFTIDKVGWHTQTPGNTETVQNIHRRFHSVIEFLQDNGLTVRVILLANSNITDDLSINSSDLTDLGMALMKKCYSKWLQRVDHGLPPTDVSVFEKELMKMRDSD
jgi:hypothetical protein